VASGSTADYFPSNSIWIYPFIATTFFVFYIYIDGMQSLLGQSGAVHAASVGWFGGGGLCSMMIGPGVGFSMFAAGIMQYAGMFIVFFMKSMCWLFEISKGLSAISSSGRKVSSAVLPHYATVKDSVSSASVHRMLNIYNNLIADKDSRKILIFLSINFAFMLIEVIYGIASNSLGMISDAAHMLFDCTALVIGLYASYVSRLKPDDVFTYGYGRYETIAGFVNGIFLVFIGFSVFIESVEVSSTYIVLASPCWRLGFWSVF
jgi:hypothetical protein